MRSWRLMAQRSIAMVAVGPIALTVGLWATAGGAAAAHVSPIPKDWKTYIYGKAAISVPKTWTVRHTSYGCAARVSASGTLFLLRPSRSDLCVRSTYNTNSVTISPLVAGTTDSQPSCPLVKVNRLTVSIGPCAASNAGGITVWSVPALGIQALGTGTTSENVTGGGNGTVVGRILHTLRRRH